MGAPDDLAAVVRGLMAAHDERGARLTAAYYAMSRAQREGALLAEYRCSRRAGCLLLTAWQAGGLRGVWLPPYRLSPGLNGAESTPEGRARNAVNGVDRWPVRVLAVDDLAGPVGLPLNCSHFHGVVTSAVLLADVDAATPGRPTRRVYPL